MLELIIYLCPVLKISTKVAQLVEHNLPPEAERIDATLGRFEDAKTLFDDNAKVAQLVEHNLPKVGVAGSSPVFRSEG